MRARGPDGRVGLLHGHAASRLERSADVAGGDDRVVGAGLGKHMTERAAGGVVGAEVPGHRARQVVSADRIGVHGAVIPCDLPPGGGRAGGVVKAKIWRAFTLRQLCQIRRTSTPTARPKARQIDDCAITPVSRLNCRLYECPLENCCEGPPRRRMPPSPMTLRIIQQGMRNVS